MVLVRMPRRAYRMLAEALRDAEVIGTGDSGAADPVEALERVPEVGPRERVGYALPLSHVLAVEKIRTELMYSRGLAASRVSRWRVVAAAIALYHVDVFGREIDELKGREDPPR